jgi:hypothetical protein
VVGLLLATARRATPLRARPHALALRLDDRCEEVCAATHTLGRSAVRTSERHTAMPLRRIPPCTDLLPVSEQGGGAEVLADRWNESFHRRAETSISAQQGDPSKRRCRYPRHEPSRDPIQLVALHQQGGWRERRNHREGSGTLRGNLGRSSPNQRIFFRVRVFFRLWLRSPRWGLGVATAVPCGPR